MSIARMTGGKNFFALSCFLFLLFFSSSVMAAAAEVEAIRQEIWNKGARWSAEETSISALPLERRLKRVSLMKGTASVPRGAVLESRRPVAAPSAAYLNYNDSNEVTPVRDQGDCGSCWAFATTAALESQVLINAKGAGASTLDLSEETLLSCCGAQVCGDCNGGYIDSASAFIQNSGLPDENCFPYSDYSSTNQTAPNCSSTQCPNWQNNSDGINRWHWVALTSPTVAGLKSALATYGPLVTTMNVYADFFHYRHGIYSYVKGAYQGGHAIEIVGYDDDNRCFIVKNSWGTDWGEGGFFRIDYDQISRPVQFGHFTIAYEGHNAIQSSCSYSISPTSKTVTYTGGSASETVSSQSGCNWSAVSDAGWIEFMSGAQGSGNGTATYLIAANNTSSSRTGTLTIAGQTLTVTQTAPPSSAQNRHSHWLWYWW